MELEANTLEKYHLTLWIAILLDFLSMTRLKIREKERTHLQ